MELIALRLHLLHGGLVPRINDESLDPDRSEYFFPVHLSNAQLLTRFGQKEKIYGS